MNSTCLRLLVCVSLGAIGPIPECRASWPDLAAPVVALVSPFRAAAGASTAAGHDRAAIMEAAGQAGPGGGGTMLSSTPGCPWDCGDGDGTVGIVDFLALLGEWSSAGSPCDFDDSGVGITDFLALLSNWGPCTLSNPNECATAQPIVAGDSPVPFDISLATPSPEPYQCAPGFPTVFDDIWYRLSNTTGEPRLVALSTTNDVFMEVAAGGTGTCPPGPLVTCQPGMVGTGLITMQPGEQLLIRLINDGAPADQLSGELIIQSVAPSDDVNFYFGKNALDFYDALPASQLQKLEWYFTPDLPLPGGAAGLDDPLDYWTHANNDPDPWDTLWPPAADKVQFSSNMTPQGPLTPRGLAGMFYRQDVSPPDTRTLTANYFPDSLDICFSPPCASPPIDPVSALALEIINNPGFDTPQPRYHVTVFDLDDHLIGLHTVESWEKGQKYFLGMIINHNPARIGRVDIWDENGGPEGIASLTVYVLPVNDNCADSIPIFNGATPFSNVSATNDGPAACDDLGSDIWYSYTATCTGTLTVKTCGSLYDTVIAAYPGCACPVGTPLACNDDFCDVQSRITLHVPAGNCYTIRVGGWMGDQGSGTITITCDDEACAPTAGPCCVAHGSPGCGNNACCNRVCAIDPFCCDTAWDGICASEAATFPQCGCSPAPQ